MKTITASIKTFKGNATVYLSDSDVMLRSFNVDYGDSLVIDDFDNEDECIKYNMNCIKDEIRQNIAEIKEEHELSVDEESIENILSSIRIYVSSKVSDSFSSKL